MNKEIIVNNKTYLFVEVPNDATDFHYDSWFTRYINHSKGAIKLDVNTKIISTTKDITEEQAKSLVVKSEYSWYLTYTKGNMDSYHCQTAKESLQSLIQDNELNINKNYLILLKLQNNE